MLFRSRQIEIASTGKLNLQQKDIIFFGHAIECRINAEDPSKDFLPSDGTIKTYKQQTKADHESWRH